jgi:hypothetical protein
MVVCLDDTARHLQVLVAQCFCGRVQIQICGLQCAVLARKAVHLPVQLLDGGLMATGQNGSRRTDRRLGNRLALSSIPKGPGQGDGRAGLTK